MAAAHVRLVLAGASVAMLFASVAGGSVATWLGALAAAVFPAALMLLAAPRRERIAPWIAALTASLSAGMLIAVTWRGSPFVAGLPVATWLTWLLLAVVPFALVLYGIGSRKTESR